MSRHRTRRRLIRVEKRHGTAEGGRHITRLMSGLEEAQIVCCFGARAALITARPFATLRADYPKARFVGCSTAGEICGTEVRDNSVVSVAVAFEGTRAEVATGRRDGGARGRRRRLPEAVEGPRHD